ncbi:MAG: transposase [Thermodesulfovibrionales bacterium]
MIVHKKFRDGNAMGGAVEAIKAAYRMLPEGTKIRHASLDSEFYTADVINLLMDNCTTFTIAVDKDYAVKELIRGIQDWQPFHTEEGEETDREIAEAVHTINNTEKSFRLVVIRWKNTQGDLFHPEEYNYHAIATDLECSAEEAVWEYHDRGQMENIIKELKIGIAMEGLPSGDFGANSFWFALGVIVYNTFIFQRELVLPKHYGKKTIQTLRWALIEIAGKVVRHGRRVFLLLATTWDKYRIYFQMRKRCMSFT